MAKQPLHEVLRFAALALALTWLGWAPLVLHAHGVRVPLGQGWHFLGSLGPACAAFVAVALDRGSAGVRALVARLLMASRRRALVVAVLGPFALMIAGLLATRLVAGRWPELQRFGTSSEFAGLPAWLYIPAALVFFGYGEEVGWRGYLIPRLQERMSPRSAALLFVPLWALWHLPLFFSATTLSTMSAGAIVGWVASLAVGSVLLGWLFNAGGGAVLPAALFHGLVDVVFLVPDGSGQFSSIVGAAITLWGVVVLLVPGRWGIRDTPAP